MKMCIRGLAFCLICPLLRKKIMLYCFPHKLHFPNVSGKDKLFYLIYYLTANDMVALYGAVILSSDKMARNRKEKECDSVS